MIIVKVTPELIEQVLRTGNVSQKIRILRGLPDNAQLCDARMVDGLLELLFSDLIPGDVVLDIEIQSIYE